MSSHQFIKTLCTLILLTTVSSVSAAPKKDIAREISRCNSENRLCRDVADIDRKNREPSGKACDSE